MELSTRSLILNADSPVDMQLHTTNSDGTWIPEQLVDYLVAEQLWILRFTDRNNGLAQGVKHSSFGN